MCCTGEVQKQWLSYAHFNSIIRFVQVETKIFKGRLNVPSNTRRNQIIHRNQNQSGS